MLFTQPPAQEPLYQQLIAIVQKQEEPKVEVKPITYTFQRGDVLEKVALDQNTTVQRIFSKNPSITHPDRINAGETIQIPLNDEVLPTRAMPVSIEVRYEATQQTSAPSGRSSVSGNSYSYGYCTYFVKQMRPDIPNGLGNADLWYSRYPGAKGSEPAVGAVAVAKGYMHVAYVLGVEGDHVRIREMNYNGWNVVSERTTSAAEFLYIY